eukprot:CAMPEP_0114495924 /NCGR_PEP_ID=MMETSP0109-20121206/5490_1 /TAXON_ID=29199 /ORGANISM="Chlorarachnion reptans, Strain CCCM449" /LENGTH=377 /DNA_ID=CAMNT_0001673151 /DNA_START=338 /DNA_END=1472 /DNA_ORIENTATION=+
MLVNEREHPYKPSRSEMNKDDGGDVNIAINQKKMEDAKEEEEVERKMKRLERAVKWLFRKKEIPAKETTALPKPQDVVKTGPFCALTEDGIPVVSCAGAGIFIFWQMGALKYISTHFDMRKAKLHGGSAGAVLSTFIASGVDLDQAVRESYNIGMEARVWSRSKLEHFGLFGPLIKQWLENLLPDDAHERCSGRVRLLLTSVPNFKQQYVSEFLSREDLIAAVMASIHVPFFLNLKPLKSFRGGYYMDGTLDDFISRENSPILGCDGRAFVVDYYEDEGLQPKKLDFLRLKSHKEVLRLFARGRRYARNLDLQGGLDACLGSVRVVPAGMDSNGKRMSHRMLKRKVFHLTVVGVDACYYDGDGDDCGGKEEAEEGCG